MKTFKVGTFNGKPRYIGKGEPIFIAAEIGVTCTYNMQMAKDLIDVAKQSGADAVKLAFHFPDDLLSDHSVEYTYQTVRGTRTENMYEMFDYLRFSLEEWKELKDYADKKEIFMFASVAGGFKGIEWAEELGFPMHKIGAWDLLDIPQWHRLRESGKPLIIDVGTVHEEEMKTFMNIVKDTDTVLLHEYHSKDYAQMNIKSIPYIEKTFNTLVGFSSPNTYDVNDYMSIALGSVVLEKRLTLSRSNEGHHHILGKEPEEFAEWVKDVRRAEAALGKDLIRPTDTDLKDRKKYFKRVVARRPIKAGEKLTPENITCKRPATGGLCSSKYYDLIGSISLTDLDQDDPINSGDINEEY